MNSVLQDELTIKMVGNSAEIGVSTMAYHAIQEVKRQLAPEEAQAAVQAIRAAVYGAVAEARAITAGCLRRANARMEAKERET
jgi:hypothetical protein